MADEELIVPYADPASSGEIPDEQPLVDPYKALPSSGSKSEETWLDISDRWAQGLSSNILSGLTIGFSKHLPNIPEESQQNIAQFNEEHPVVAGVSEVAGAVGTGALGAKAIATKAPAVSAWITSKIPGWAQMAGIGTVEGGIYAANTAKSGERLEAGAQGAAIGGVAGPVGGGLLKLGGKIFTGISSVIQRILANTPDQQAKRILEAAIKNNELTPEFIQAELDRLGPKAVLADTDESLARVARGTTALDQKSHGIAENFLEGRQIGQQGRLLDAAGPDAFDPEDFARRYSQWSRSRIKDADKFYDEAYAANLEATDNLLEIMNRPSVQKAFAGARKILAEENVPVTDVRIFDAVKRIIDDDIGVAIRQGQLNKVRLLTKTKNAMLAEIDEQVPSYKAARNTFAGEAQLKDAAEMGYEVVTKKKDLWILEEAITAMGDSEKFMFRQGALRGLVDKLDSTAETRNVAQKLIESKRARQVLKMVFPDEASFDDFLAVAEAESRFSMTRGTVRGGSPTSRIDEDKAALQTAASVSSAVSQEANALSMALRLFKELGFTDVSPETLGIVTKALFSGNTDLLNRAAARGVTVAELTKTIAAASSGAAGAVSAIDKDDDQ